MSALEELSKATAEAVERASRSVVRVEGRRRLPATGIAWSNDGVVVTAHHVLERDEEIEIGLPGGGKTTASVAGRDPSTDLAVLRLKEAASPPQWADSTSVRVGHLVLALGRPGDSILATLGVISATGLGWRMPGSGLGDRFVQTDVVMYPGFSGGPLINAAGEVLGMNTSGLARGISLTVPHDTLRGTVEMLLQHGEIRRGYLGVGAQTVRLPETSKARQTTGLLLASIEPGSPADRGGLVLGDVLLALDGVRLEEMDDLLAALGPERVGKKVAVDVLRGGEPRTVQVEIGERSHDRGRRPR
jgi:S1-C subfamily serine protease